MVPAVAARPAIFGAPGPNQADPDNQPITEDYGNLYGILSFEYIHVKMGPQPESSLQ